MRRRQGASARGERLLALLQGADFAFPALVALGDLLDALARDRETAPAAVELAVAVEARGIVLAAVASAVETEEDEPLPATTSALPPAPRAPGGATPRAAAEVAYAAALLRELDGVLNVLLAAAREGSEKVLPAAGWALEDDGAGWAERAWRPLRDQLSLSSVVLRHAFRVGVTAAAAVAAAPLLGLAHPQWVTVAAVVVLQPYAGATLLKGVQRVLGTAVGALAAAGVAAWAHEPRALLGIVIVLAIAGVSVLPVNYTAYAALLTPAFVLLAELNTGDWHLAGARVVATLVGGTLALAATHLLWPTAERVRFPAPLAAALRSTRAYLAEAAAPATPDGAARIAQARRRTGLAVLNAEASFQRLLPELAGREGEAEGWLAALLYLRRLGAAVTTLAWVRAPAEGAEGWTASADAALGDLADAVGEGRAPSALPPGLRGAEGAEPALGVRAERVGRQLSALHAAVTRALAGG